MAETKWQITDLPEEQQKILRQIYGVQINPLKGYAPTRQIQFVRELTESEKRLFDNNALMSVQSMTQTLYKVKGKLSPMRLNRAINDMAKQTESLRLNFCPVGDEHIAVVFNEHGALPQIVYRNMQGMDADELDGTLRKIMEANMRQGFDLRHDCLARFSVFQTGIDEYAVLLTVAQPIRGTFGLAKLLRNAMDIDSPKDNETTELIDAWLNAQRSRLTGALRDYWTQLMADLPPLPKLPYLKKSKRDVQKQKAYLAHIPPDIFSDLKHKARSNVKMLLAVLQTAWGFLLETHNDCQDTAYCLIVPGNRNSQAEGAQNMIPVRLTCRDNQTVKEIVDKSFQQFIVSQPYSSFDWQEIQTLTSGGHFDHFLGFYDFLTEEPSYTKTVGEPTGKIVAQSSWDSRGMKLGIYFRQEEDHISLSFLYDGDEFAANAMERIAKDYRLILQQMLTDWNLPFSEFRLRLIERQTGTQKTEAAETPDISSKISDAVSRLQLLQYCDEGSFDLFRAHGRLETRFEGDRISGGEIETQFIFVIKGKVARSIEYGDGWYNTLDILRENSWANETIFLSDKKTHMSIEVLTEQAVFLVVPLTDAHTLLKNNPTLGLNIIRHLERQLEKYQRLWLQS